MSGDRGFLITSGLTQFFQAEAHNRNSFDNFRKDNGSHAEHVSLIYEGIGSNLDIAGNSAEQMAQWILYMTAYRAYFLGLSLISNGHITDLLHQGRVLVETLRHSLFIHNHPKCALYWMNANEEGKVVSPDKYRKKYRAWLKKTGLQLLKREFPKLTSVYEQASNRASHPLFESNMFRVSFSKDQKSVAYSFMDFSGLNPREVYSRVSFYYGFHLLIHLHSLRWWLKTRLKWKTSTLNLVSYSSDFEAELTRMFKEYYVREKKVQRKRKRVEE